MKDKGTKFERELIHILWQRGFAAMRSAGSGAARYPTPDIIAGNRQIFLAIEVKMRSRLPVYLADQEINELKCFSDAFGAVPLIAVRVSRSGWRFFKISSLYRTDRGYSINKSNFKDGFDLSKLLEWRLNYE